jgi:integrase
VKQAGRRTKERERVLEDWELQRLWKAVGEQDGMSGTVADMLRLLMLLPARRGEVAGMMWGELNLEEGLWAIPAERMKAGRKHELPLSASTVDLLRARRQRLEKEATEEKRKVLPWVFPDAAGEGPMDGKRAGKVCGRLAEKWHKDREKEAGEALAPAPFGPHDLRRTFTTRMTEAAGKRGFTVDNIRRVIAHNVYGGEAFANYDHYQYREEKRDILNAWEAELLRIVEGKAPPENVVPLRPTSAAAKSRIPA